MTVLFLPSYLLLSIHLTSYGVCSKNKLEIPIQRMKKIEKKIEIYILIPRTLLIPFLNILNGWLRCTKHLEKVTDPKLKDINTIALFLLKTTYSLKLRTAPALTKRVLKWQTEMCFQSYKDVHTKPYHMNRSQMSWPKLFPFPA